MTNKKANQYCRKLSKNLDLGVLKFKGIKKDIKSSANTPTLQYSNSPQCIEI